MKSKCYELSSVYKQFEQRLVVRFLWMKELGNGRIHTELIAVIGDDCYSLASIEH
jgi:hypothetical protein